MSDVLQRDPVEAETPPIEWRWEFHLGEGEAEVVALLFGANEQRVATLCMGEVAIAHFTIAYDWYEEYGHAAYSWRPYCHGSFIQPSSGADEELKDGTAYQKMIHACERAAGVHL